VIPAVHSLSNPGGSLHLAWSYGLPALVFFLNCHRLHIIRSLPPHEW